jgi:hypothetical protein
MMNLQHLNEGNSREFIDQAHSMPLCKFKSDLRSVDQGEELLASKVCKYQFRQREKHKELNPDQEFRTGTLETSIERA